ncbi:MAG TPA: cation-transporting P-type ATPase [Holophagaceae bacterium]|nr:cation-transporting P-type ATPase [Holophagaceae bacterium]
MQFHLLPLDEALAGLRSSPEGLTTEEAARRLVEFGPNRVEPVRNRSLLWELVRQFVHFFALILWVAAGLCFLAEWRDPGGGMAKLGVAILVVILVNGLFAFWQEAKAEQAVRGLEALLPMEVLVARNGRLVQRAAEALVPGDVVVLEDGDLVPADVRLLEGFGLMVNASVLTGESAPLPRDVRPETEASPLRARNVLLAGTSIVSGQGKGLVYATGMRTEFGRIAGLTQSVEGRVSTLQREITRVSRTIALLALAIGGTFFLLGRTLGLTFWQNLVFAVGIIVANVPEGLLPTVTLALAMASQRMARRHALVRNLPTVETLGSATVICTDKTGTLTQNRMVVRRIYADGHLTEVGSAALPTAGPARLFEGARRCQTLKGGPGAWHGDPMEVALLNLGETTLGATAPWPQVDEVPFDSDRRRLSLLLKAPEGPVLHTKGALAALLPLCTQVEEAGVLRGLSEADRRRYLEMQDQLAAQGLRVIAFAWRPVAEGTPREELERDLVLTGLVALEDPPRPEVPAAIATCQAAGIRVFMVTGDHPLTALAVARQIGLVRSERARVITGEELRRYSDAHLQLLLDERELVFARLDADQKHQIVKVLQRKGEVVAVTGDGVNDAPALKAADIGVAMGRSGTEVARQAADLVLADDNFASIVAAVEEGRAIYTNIRRFLTYHMTSNCGELMPYLAFVLVRIPLPLTILQILAIDLGTDMVPALALGAEPPSAEVMTRPPRSRAEPLLNGQVLARAYGVLGLVEGAAGLAAYAMVLKVGGWQWGQPLLGSDPLYLRATTACLSGIIVMQMVAVFLCRHESRSSFRSGGNWNVLLLTGVGLEFLVLMALNHVPFVQRALGTAAMPGAAWLVLIPFGVVMVALEEGRKAWARRHGR